MPPRDRSACAQRILTEWGAAVERMLTSPTLEFPKSSPLVQLMEYGTSTFSGYRGSSTAEGLPHYLRRLDRLVNALPDNQRTICTMR